MRSQCLLPHRRLLLFLHSGTVLLVQQRLHIVPGTRMQHRPLRFHTRLHGGSISWLKQQNGNRGEADQVGPEEDSL